MIPPEMGIDDNVEVVLDVEQAGRDGACHQAKNESARHRRIREGHFRDWRAIA